LLIRRWGKLLGKSHTGNTEQFPPAVFYRIAVELTSVLLIWSKEANVKGQSSNVKLNPKLKKQKIFGIRTLTFI